MKRNLMLNTEISPELVRMKKTWGTRLLDMIGLMMRIAIIVGIYFLFLHLLNNPAFIDLFRHFLHR